VTPLPGTLAAYVHGCNIYLKNLQGHFFTPLASPCVTRVLKHAAAPDGSATYNVTRDVLADGSCKGPMEVPVSHFVFELNRAHEQRYYRCLLGGCIVTIQYARRACKVTGLKSGVVLPVQRRVRLGV
jgi:hypothetical protein